MTPHLETFLSIGQDLDEARAKIREARQRLQADSQDAHEIRHAVTRLERLASELTRIEAGIAFHVQACLIIY